MSLLTPSVEVVASALEPKALVAALRQAFSNNAQPVDAARALQAPLRTHHVIEDPAGREQNDTHLLIMPAWEVDGFIGVKIVGVNASNPSRFDRPQPMVQGIYLLLDAQSGAPVVQFDAQELTFRRTTAVSALGGDYLARPDATRLGILGAGAAIAPYLVEAYQAVRPIEHVMLWNRTKTKAERLAQDLSARGLTVELCDHPDDVVPNVDIIGCCTPSEQPLVKGALVQPGTHVDCLGGFRPTMREADDALIAKASVYGDTLAGVLSEAGDIMIPLSRGVLKKDDICGDLFGLCSGAVQGRTGGAQVTFFKSVGSALSDLAGAKLVFDALAEKAR